MRPAPQTKNKDDVMDWFTQAGNLGASPRPDCEPGLLSFAPLALKIGLTVPGQIENAPCYGLTPILVERLIFIRFGWRFVFICFKWIRLIRFDEDNFHPCHIRAVAKFEDGKRAVVKP